MMREHQGVDSKSRASSSPAVSERLVQSVWKMWEIGGHASISARSLAQDAGIPISSLYNHFESLDHVFLGAQVEALTQSRLWCAEQLEHLFDLTSENSGTLVANGLGSIMAALIDEWTQGCRRLAFAWREGFLLARRDPRFMPHWQAWRDLWTTFWQTVCEHCGLGTYGEWTCFIFEAEAPLHMLPWRRTLDRACLEELCEGWAIWLDGHLASEGPWRRKAREQAMASFPDLPIHDETTRRIAVAAADVVENQGMPKLTHRAVAASAGVSLGMVSSRFRTSVDLVRAAFEAIYQRAAGPYLELPLPDQSARSIEQIMPQLTGEQMHAPDRLAFEELMLAVARTPDLQSFAPQLRYLRGRTSGRILQRMASDAIAISPLDAALFSDLLSGMQRSVIHLSPQDRAGSGRQHIERLICLLNLPQAEE